MHPFSIPNTAFRIAFWSLICAIGLSVAIVCLDPRTRQFVSELHTHNLPAQLAEKGENRADARSRGLALTPQELAEKNGQLRLAPDPYTLSSMSGEFSANENLEIETGSQPIRIASVDPHVPVGPLTLPPPKSAKQPVSSAGNGSPLARSTGREGNQQIDAWAAANVAAPSPHEQPLPSIPLAELYPEQQLSRLRADLTNVQVMRLQRQLAEVRREEREKLQQLTNQDLESIGRTIAVFRERESGAFQSAEDVKRPAPEIGTDASSPQANAPTVSQDTVDAVERVEISPSLHDGGWDIRFHDAPLHEGLSELGRQLGWHVFVDNRVQGELSGEYLQADLEQTLTMLLKAYHLRMVRRGNYMLIREE